MDTAIAKRCLKLPDPIRKLVLHMHVSGSGFTRLDPIVDSLGSYQSPKLGYDVSRREPQEPCVKRGGTSYRLSIDASLVYLHLYSSSASTEVPTTLFQGSACTLRGQVGNRSLVALHGMLASSSISRRDTKKPTQLLYEMPPKDFRCKTGCGLSHL